ncbi:MAG: ABC transporter permease [Bacteroidota bacterium]
MNILENIKEGLRSIRSNMLRTVLTALIIAIGITSLVGILTAIDGIQSSVDNNFASLGANSFDLKSPQFFRRRRDGRGEKISPPIDFREAMAYKERFGFNAVITVSTNISGSSEVKYGSKKTNPNTQIVGADDNFLGIKGYKLEGGRNFSKNDIESAMNVVMIGYDVKKLLFDEIDPLNKEITTMGMKYKIIGVLEKKGSMNGGESDRVIIMPIQSARNIAGNRRLTFDITTSVPNITDLEGIMGEAAGVMRVIRQDRIGQPNSFELERSDSFAQEFEKITGYLRIGGFGIGFITLLGASIALMNIMMVSVTERTREIGIRKSLGATPTRIRQQFLIEAIVICIIGGLGGLVLGISVGNLISKLISAESSFIVPWLWMFFGILICVIVGVISGIYPAIKASKLDPIESLRYE